MTTCDGHAAWMEQNDLPTDVTIPAQYWDDDCHWMFDPWASREKALNIHGPEHMAWAERMFDNWQQRNCHLPAAFNWKDETVYLVGRGVSLPDAIPALNSSARQGRAIFLNSAYAHLDVHCKEQDFAMSFEAKISRNEEMKKRSWGMNFITAPIMAPEVFAWDWRCVFNFTFWNDAPLNNFMRKLFPDLPQLVECLGVSCSALHLAALNGAKKIILVGQDNAHLASDEEPEDSVKGMRLPDGRIITAHQYYAQIAMANTILAFFVHKRTGAQIVNCSGIPLVGMDLFGAEGLTPVPWMTCDKLENHLE